MNKIKDCPRCGEYLIHYDERYPNIKISKCGLRIPRYGYTHITIDERHSIYFDLSNKNTIIFVDGQNKIVLPELEWKISKEYINKLILLM